MTLPEENTPSTENPGPAGSASPPNDLAEVPNPETPPTPLDISPSIPTAPPETPPPPIRAEVYGPAALPPGPSSSSAPKKPRPTAAPIRSFIGVSPAGLVLAAALTILLSVALSLGILALANQGLSYAPRSDTAALKVQVEELKAQVDRQEADLSGLRTRVDAVEKLAARTTVLEQAASSLQSELDKRTADLENLRGLVGDAQKQIEKVITQSGAFETFVAGLRGVLNQLPGFKP